MSRASMKRYWDARAREDPFFFVDNRLDYRAPDLDRFWAGGEELLDAGLDRVAMAIRPEDRVVEIGCGLGRMTRAIAARGAHVRAVDVSAEMLARARELNAHLVNVEWIQGDGTTLRGIGDASATVCYSDVVFQHVPDPEVTLGYVGEIGRVLEPGGWAAFQVSNDPRIHARPPAHRRARLALLGLLRRAPRGQSHPAWLGSPMDLDALAATGASAGLDLERVVGKGTQFCHVLLRRR